MTITTEQRILFCPPTLPQIRSLLFIYLGLIILENVPIIFDILLCVNEDISHTMDVGVFSLTMLLFAILVLNALGKGIV